MQIQYLNKLLGNCMRNYCAGGPPPTGTSSSPAQRAARPTQTNNAAPEHPWGHTAPQPHSTTTTSTHNETRPRPVSRPRPRHSVSADQKDGTARIGTALIKATVPPAIRRSCPRDPRPRRGQPRGGRRGRGTGSRTRSPGPRHGRSGSTAGRHRARHTRRA